MRILWARTIRVRCVFRDRRCRRFSTVVARRPTTAAASRAVPTPLSTLLYSAVFAVAAVADGHVKEQRRNQWNTAISGVKEELGLEEWDTEHPGHGPTEDTAQLTSGHDEADAFADHILDPEDEDWMFVQEYSMLRRGRPEWPVNLASDLPSIERNLPPQSLYAHDGRKAKGLRQRWSRRKLQTVNYSMTLIVIKLLLDTDISKRAGDGLDMIPQSLHPFAQLSRPELALKLKEAVQAMRVTKEIKRERSDEIPDYQPIVGEYPSYQQDSDGQYHRECAILNKTLYGLFEKAYHRTLSWETFVDQVCDRILTSTAPPNVTTYNTLITGFSKLKQDQAVSYMIKSVEDCHIRPDEITITSILRRFRILKDQPGFERFVDHMRCTSRQALMHARPTLKQNSVFNTKGFVVPKPDESGDLMQKVRPTPKVLSELVRGYLAFLGFEGAVMNCADLAKEGWGLDINSIHIFLKECVKRRDWESGRALWSQLEQLQRRCNTTLHHERWESMLELCWLCDKETEFRTIFQRAIAYHGKGSVSHFKDFLLFLQGRQEEKLAEKQSPPMDEQIRADYTPKREMPSLFAF